MYPSLRGPLLNKLLQRSHFCVIDTEQKKGPQPQAIGSYKGETYCNFTHLNKTSGSNSAVNISFLQTQHDGRTGENRELYIRGGADKSLARPTSRCRWTKSIVSLERGVCSCAELQVFSCYRG